MCGIAGAWSLDGLHSTAEIAGRMADELAHRGPDDGGLVKLAEGRIALSHRRLAIQDLSSEGAQPMRSACGRWTMVFNGEIYNQLEIRAELGARIDWRGHSDTETLIESIACRGLDRTLADAVGMYAFALWDAVSLQLTLARDPIGEKPLYWGRKGGTLFFGSEMGAVLRSGLGPFEVDPSAVHDLLNMGYIPDPKSVLRGVQKLRPGSRVDIRADRGSFSITEVSHWSLEEASSDARTDLQPVRTAARWEAEVQDALKAAVRRQLISDVPVGAFLSGGIDSSLIVALMSQVASGPVRTFTIALPGDWNEAPRAEAMAKHLGTSHTTIPISEEDCLDVIPKLPQVYSEPFGDSSQVPTLLVAQAARRDVTVVLSGDGGDELFGGYNRHVAGRRLWHRLEGLNPVLRRMGGGLADSSTGARLGTALGWLGSGGGTDLRRKLRIEKGLALAGARSERDFYERLVTAWRRGGAPSPGAVGWRLPAPDWVDVAPGLDVAERFMARDIELSLPGDMLVKVDRAAMAHSLETRVPFLDPSVIALALRLPVELKLDGREGKKILRRILAPLAPDGWFDAPEAQQKQGFGIPVGRWLRDDLRDWAESLLTNHALDSNPFLDRAAVLLRWREFNGGRALEMPMFTLLLFQAWYQEYRDCLAS